MKKQDRRCCLERITRLFKRSGGAALRIIALAVAMPIIYKTALVTFPYVHSLFRGPALASASINMFDGINNSRTETLENDISVPFSEVISHDDFTAFAYINKPSVRKPSVKTDSISVPEASKAQLPADIRPVNAGSISRKTYSAGSTKVYIPLKSGHIKNCTTLSHDEVRAAAEKKPQFTIKADKSPEVLIMHTHATESYQDRERSWYDKSYNSRTTDNTKNVISVGEKIKKQLEEAGIGTIHDKTQHDYPSYNGAYERSAVTVKRILKENPSIKVVLDIHRDAIQPSSDTMIAPVTTINGKKAAQVMIISGCDNGKLNMPNYLENLKFSAALQSQMEGDYPTLTRPVLFDYRKYNQDLTTGSILIEVGGHANTLEEAQYAGELIGNSLSRVLLDLKKSA